MDAHHEYCGDMINQILAKLTILKLRGTILAKLTI